MNIYIRDGKLFQILADSDTVQDGDQYVAPCGLRNEDHVMAEHIGKSVYDARCYFHNVSVAGVMRPLKLLSLDAIRAIRGALS